MVDVIPGGSGSSLDVELVAARAAALPGEIRAALADRGIRIVACRDNVTDYQPNMAELLPRNWPAGVTWSVVPGCFIPAQSVVVIATLGDDDERHIPAKGEKHGSFDLVIHEVMHADDILLQDNVWRRRSDNPQFRSAWAADIAAQGFERYAYERAQAEEAYAESAARHFAGDDRLEVEWPAMAEFWRSTSYPVAVGETRRAIVSRGTHSVGTARALGEAGFQLDLVATSEDGIIGHALVALEPGDAGYDAVDRQFSRRRDFGSEIIVLEPF
ncbi:hypothetical protein [Sphingobium lignivorans]|uniref:ATLF-like domain-containing protein n=1 Tax=Sphingobium lignivorans TaxID=2735886 RepID=A0ABR6NIZ7_9SPHN|nr:hypothetical protein [Sphingobium lignivorans]MBB5986602.1 hypothetical protein [Sphingobium lignivorans]